MIEDEGTTGEETPDTPEIPDELALLKQRADIMGIKYHPNIGLDTLKAKIAEKKEGVTPEAPAEDAPEDSGKKKAQIAGGPVSEKEATRLRKLEKKQKALALVRIRVTCMNPLKGNLKGQIFSVGNGELGMIKKFIPFNAEQGWHVPQILVDDLRRRKFMSHYEVKVGNKKVKKHRLVPEYAIEVMKPLTDKELHDLKQRQIIASGGSDR